MVMLQYANVGCCIFVTSSFVFCYENHEGPICILQFFHVDWFCYTLTCIMATLSYEICEGSFWIATFIYGHVALWYTYKRRFWCLWCLVTFARGYVVPCLFIS